MTYNILLVDDEISQIKTVELFIEEKMNYKTKIVDNGQEAIDILTSENAGGIDLVLLDISMPGVSGIDVLKAVKPVQPNLPIIVRTGYNDVDLAIEAMKAGAYDFVKKVDENERLQTSINNALRVNILKSELSQLKKTINKGFTFEDIIGKSAAKENMLTLGLKAASSNIPVLIEGESGVGKELLARAVHSASDRKEKPFIAVNCGAIPENLVESTLFGHEKGAFTGALYKTVGKFREAEGGTLFLDEISELKPDIQVKLLRALQEGEIEPVGSGKLVKVDVRIISATNKNLEEEVKENNFREDLYYRLHVFPIYVPSLKERKEDIEEMVNYFIQKFSEAEGKKIDGIEKNTMEILKNHEWMGNIRQLKNAIFRAIVLSEKPILSNDDFPQIISDRNKFGSESSALNLSLIDKDGHIKAMNKLESEIIEKALEFYEEKMSEIARRLEIGRSTLYRKLNEFGIEVKSKSDSDTDAA